jgi:hypothetical protein
MFSLYYSMPIAQALCAIHARNAAPVGGHGKSSFCEFSKLVHTLEVVPGPYLFPLGIVEGGNFAHRSYLKKVDISAHVWYIDNAELREISELTQVI